MVAEFLHPCVDILYSGIQVSHTLRQLCQLCGAHLRFHRIVVRVATSVLLLLNLLNALTGGVLSSL